MKTRIGRHFDFEAAHQLQGSIYGNCQNLHGHRYQLTVEVEGEVNQYGWVCDFSELEAIAREHIVLKFDHGNMNDFFKVPTVENIARYIFDKFEEALKEKAYRVSRVLLYETADSYAEVTR